MLPEPYGSVVEYKYSGSAMAIPVAWMRKVETVTVAVISWMVVGAAAVPVALVIPAQEQAEE